jgi:hypothetical protein
MWELTASRQHDVYGTIRSGDSGSSTHKKGKKAKAISTALRVLASTGAHIPGVRAEVSNREIRDGL